MWKDTRVNRPWCMPDSSRTPYSRITTPAGLGLLGWGSGWRVGVGYREKALRLLKVVVCGRIRE